MKKVIRIPEVENEEVKESVKFTHCFITSEGWCKDEEDPNKFDKVIYLGNCRMDGDMFAVYEGELINIFKGHLNSGEY